MVAKGFHQVAGFDFHETFSPVVKPTTIRIILTIALTNHWAVRQLDIDNAFLNGDLKEEIFMEQPPGFESPHTAGLVCKLHKALYGLKQAPKAWFDKLHATLLNLGFTSAKSDQSLFIKITSEYKLYLLVYVDDILLTGTNKTIIESLIRVLHQQFRLKDLGNLNHFLGIQISHLSTGGFHLSQKKYIQDLLYKSNMANSKGAHTPMTTGSRLSALDDQPFQDVHLYRSIVGTLQYITITRPEIAFSVNKVCQFMQNPSLTHWQAVKRILRYLNGSLELGLSLQPAQYTSLRLEGFCDADWASDPDDRRSTSGFCVYLGPNPVSWQSKKQHTISRSSTEAEYKSLAQLTAELTWISSLLTELDIHLPQPPVVWCDNLSTVLLSANPVQHARTKHIEIDLYFVREKVQRGQLTVKHVSTNEQIADILTKPVGHSQFDHLRTKLRVVQHPTLSLRGGVNNMESSS